MGSWARIQIPDEDAANDQECFAARDDQIRGVDVVPQYADVWH